MKNFLLFVLCATCIFYDAVGQCCSGGVPISSSLGLIGKEAGALQFQLTYDGNFLRDEFSGTDLQNDSRRNRNRTTQSLLLETSYDFSSTFSVSALFTSVIQSREILDDNIGQEDFVRNTGLGDAILLLKYRLFSNKPLQATQIMLGAGPKLPLGRTDFRDEQGILLPMDLQPGTGALDVIFWSHFTQNRIVRPTTQLTAIITYRLPGESTHNALRLPYDFGDEVQIQAGISDRFSLGGMLLDPGFFIKYRHVLQDKLDKLPFPNTGGEQMFLIPSLSLILSTKLSFRLSGDLPVYTRMTGRQLATSYRLSASLYFYFPLKAQTILPKIEGLPKL